jgi:RimJ/RimL family protein N-acetyltransferase
MIYELERRDFHKVQLLFQPLGEYLIFFAGVVEGGQPARVFVDDPQHPRTAFALPSGVWGYLVGEPNNGAFNRALNRAIFGREIIGENIPMMFLTCHPPDWHRQLAVICHPREPLETGRRHYVARDLKYEWRPNVPDGFEIHALDEALLERTSLIIPDDVKAFINISGDIEDALETGFGFVAVGKDASADERGLDIVVAYAAIDFIVGEMGNLRLFTSDAFRRLGLGTVTAAATIEYGLSQRLSTIALQCDSNDLAATRTADKLGFEYVRGFKSHFFIFDEAEHLTVMATRCLDSERCMDAVDLCERVLALRDDPPARVYHMAARAWAGAAEPKKAVAYLNSAADRGWSDLDRTTSCREFENLHDDPTWAAVLNRIRENQELL